jgi:glycosyltransferase involved in cell wall biosynthesis
MGHAQKISILHLITTLDLGGAEKMLLKLLSFMDKDNFSNQVICLTDVGLVGEKIMGQGIPVYALNMPRGRLNSSGLHKLWGLLRSIRPTVLQTWLYHADLLGVILGRLAGISNICWNIRCSYMDLGKYRPSTKWTIKFCSLLSCFPRIVITNSSAALKYHTRLGYKAKSWKVIPNGFDLEKFKPDQRAKPRLLKEFGLSNDLGHRGSDSEESGNKKNDIFLIGFIARYDPMKDHSTFFKAASLLLSERNNVHFVLVGKNVDLENKSIFTQVPNAGMEHFHLLGERDDMENITAGLDIASLVSHGEGFPNTVGEAMACGVPCVVTNVGDSALIVNDTGYVVPPRDPSALAKAWKELIDMGYERRRKLGIAARKRVKERFELSKIVKDYETTYSALALEGDNQYRGLVEDSKA